jgi:hypothetical protein
LISGWILNELRGVGKRVRLYDYRPIGLLDVTGTSAALTGPTLTHGVVWEPDALAAALEIASGYPYFQQLQMTME